MAARLTPTDRRRFYLLDSAAQLDELARGLREHADALSLLDNLNGTHLSAGHIHAFRVSTDEFTGAAAMMRTEAEILGLEVLDP